MTVYVAVQVEREYTLILGVYSSEAAARSVTGCTDVEVFELDALPPGTIVLTEDEERAIYFELFGLLENKLTIGKFDGKAHKA